MKYLESDNKVVYVGQRQGSAQIMWDRDWAVLRMKVLIEHSLKG